MVKIPRNKLFIISFASLVVIFIFVMFLFFFTPLIFGNQMFAISQDSIEKIDQLSEIHEELVSTETPFYIYSDTIDMSFGDTRNLRYAVLNLKPFETNFRIFVGCSRGNSDDEFLGVNFSYIDETKFLLPMESDFSLVSISTDSNQVSRSYNCTIFVRDVNVEDYSMIYEIKSNFIEKEVFGKLKIEDNMYYIQDFTINVN